MSVNTAHANNGVLIHAGESILLFSDNVSMEFSGQHDPIFKGPKNGKVYLTTHRMIFLAKSPHDSLQSFSFPFVALSEIDIEQPTFGSNYIKGKVRSQPNGNWNGEIKLKLYFKSGGAIDFGQAMMRAARMAQRNFHQGDVPPPYTPPTGSWYEAPPPAYQPQPGYYGWLPSTFTAGPPSNTVFMTDNPPPYPGISPTAPQGGFAANGFPGAAYPAAYPAQQSGSGFQADFPGGRHAAGYSQPGPGYPLGTGGYASGPQSGYPGQSAGFPTPVSSNSEAMSFTAGQPNSKEQEAAQSAYFDPNRPQTAYVPPPAYYEPPPSYDALGKKTQ